MKIWTSFEEFAKAYSPLVQSSCAKNPARCYNSEKAPALVVLEQAYGKNAAEMWLEIQLRDLSEFAGCKDKLSPMQLEQTASTIISNYGRLNVAEIQLFFARLKAGMYGYFYGNIDPMKILNAIKDFLKQRNLELDLYEKEKAAEERANQKIILDGYNEYKRLKELADNGDEEARKKLRL